MDSAYPYCYILIFNSNCILLGFNYNHKIIELLQEFYLFYFQDLSNNLCKSSDDTYTNLSHRFSVNFGVIKLTGLSTVYRYRKMPDYTCEKCAKTFKQKSHYTDHMSKKNDCSSTTGINQIIETKVREVVKTMTGKSEVTKDNLQAFVEDLHNLLWNRAGLNPQSALEHMSFFFAYRMIESQADVLNLPQECRWSYLICLKSENDVFEICVTK